MILQFPTEETLAKLPALGVAIPLHVHGQLVYESAVRGPAGRLWVRCEGLGDVRHYPGDLSIGDAALKYVDENAIKELV